MPPSKKRKPQKTLRSDATTGSLKRARKLLEQALTARDPHQIAELARQAVEIFPDFMDAHLVLADLSASAEESLPHLEQAVNAAAKELGECGFREFAGHFWGFHETRPYMGARLELARCLLGLGRVEDAIGHFRQMLELNPNDNQGVRYSLVSVYLRTERLDELESLLNRYPEDYSAEWYYARALLAFIREGDSEAARLALDAARQMNEHIPAYLAGAKQLPRELPEYVSPGEDSEAVSFVAEFLTCWRSTPGAIPWVRQTFDLGFFEEEKRTQRSVPWKRVQQVLLDLPQAEDTEWQIDLFPLSADSSGEATPWVLMIVNSTSMQPLKLQTWDERPRDCELWQHLVDEMRNPNDAEPHRPEKIQLSRKSLYKAWASKLDQLNIRCELTDELPQLELVKGNFRKMLAPDDAPGMELPADDADLAQLPQEFGEVWLAIARKIPAWIHIGNEICRPTVRLVLNESDGTILTTELLDHDPPDDWLWDGLRRVMCRPLIGEPRRPAVVRLSPDEPFQDLRAKLDGIGIRCVVNEDTRMLDELIDDLTEEVAGPRRVKSLIRSPGITPEQLGGFFAASAEFYRDAPWKRIPGDVIIQVETDAFTSGPWYAVVMGQSGMELGMALYEDLKHLRKIIAGRVSEKENARRMSALSVTFGEAFEIAPEDFDAIGQFDWPVAGKEAYPIVLRVNPGLVLRVPLAWELELLEACQRAIPELIRQTGSREADISIQLPTREITLRLKRLA